MSVELLLLTPKVPYRCSYHSHIMAYKYSTRRSGTSRSTAQKRGTQQARRTKAAKRPSITTTAGLNAFRRRKTR